MADAKDSQSVSEMVSRGKVISTTVGPYQLYGNNIVAACAELGSDYVDLSGEPGWMQKIIGAYNEQAAKSGARIVHSCGFDSIPFDLGVYYLQTAAQEKFGKPLTRVRGRVRAMNGEFSGGTAASLGATMAALEKNPALFEVLANPFSLSNGFAGPDQPADNAIYEDALIGQWVAPFIMAAINTKNISMQQHKVESHACDLDVYNFTQSHLTLGGTYQISTLWNHLNFCTNTHSSAYYD